MATGFSFSAYFRSLQILFFALLLAQVSIWGILLSLPAGGPPEAIYQEPFWLQVIAGATVLIVGASMLVRRKLLESARAQAGLQEKLQQYRALQIVIWAMLEGATLVNAVFYFVTRQNEFMYIAAATLALYFLRMPSKSKIVSELELSAAEQIALDSPPSGGDDLSVN